MARTKTTARIQVYDSHHDALRRRSRVVLPKTRAEHVAHLQRRKKWLTEQAEDLRQRLQRMEQALAGVTEELEIHALVLGEK